MSDTQRTTADLGGMFDDFVDQLKDIVKNGETVVTEDAEGKPVAVRKTISPAMANVVRQLLKDQNINASPAHKGLRKLAVESATKLPFVDPSQGTEDSPTYQ